MKPGKFWAKNIRPELRWPITDNFRRTTVTSGYDQSKKFHKRGQFADRVAEYYEKLGNHIPPELHHLMHEEMIGDPHVITVAGMQMGVSSIEWAYMVSRIHTYLPTGARVVDIGSGYGGMIGKLLRYDPTLKCTCIDFPELLKVQQYYLEQIPKETPVRFLEAGIDPGEADCFINTRSMSEMDQDQVQIYLNMIQLRLVSGGIFYSVNHPRFISEMTKWELDSKWIDLYWATYPVYGANGMELLMQRR